MEPNRNNDQNKSPEGNRPKSNIATALLITLALALVFLLAQKDPTRG